MEWQPASEAHVTQRQNPRFVNLLYSNVGLVHMFTVQCAYTTIPDCSVKMLITLKVISAYVLIPMSNISEIIYDTSIETEIANKKSHDSFQMIRLSMTLAIFQGH